MQCAGLRTFEILADLHNLLVRFFSQSLNLQIQGFQIYTHKRSFEHELFWKFNATISSATRSLPATACSPPAASNIKCKFIIASRETNAQRTKNDSLKNKRPWLGWIMLNIMFSCLDSASCQRTEMGHVSASEKGTWSIMKQALFPRMSIFQAWASPKQWDPQV